MSKRPTDEEFKDSRTESYTAALDEANRARASEHAGAQLLLSTGYSDTPGGVWHLDTCHGYSSSCFSKCCEIRSYLTDLGYLPAQ